MDILTKEVNIIQDKDLDDLLSDRCGRKIYIQTDTQGTYKLFNIKSFDPELNNLDTYKFSKYQEFCTGGLSEIYPEYLRIMLDGLCTDGLIPEGEYLIYFAW